MLILYMFLKTTLPVFIVLFVNNIFSFTYTTQDSLRVKLSKMNKFDVIGKYDCCKLINQWKFENIDDKDYRILLDIGMRQICNDNTFPLFVNKTNCEYIIINLNFGNTVNVVNILENKKNSYPIDTSLVIYHSFLLENNYEPRYYELKEYNMNQFLNIIYLNLLDSYENNAIKLKKKDYLKYLEMDTKRKNNTRTK